MQTERIAIQIQGIAPLIQHNGASATEGLKQRGRRIAGKGPDNPEEWREFLYPLDGKDQPTKYGQHKKLGHPSDAIWSCIVKASREFKADKRRTMQDAVKACVFPVGRWLIISGKTEPDFTHECQIVNPNTKGRGMRYRPAFQEGWTMDFELDVTDVESVPVAKVKEILDFAGLRIGLGEWPPLRALHGHEVCLLSPLPNEGQIPRLVFTRLLRDEYNPSGCGVAEWALTLPWPVRAAEAEAELDIPDPEHEKCGRCRTPVWEGESVPGHAGCK